VIPLFNDGLEDVKLERWAPGAVIAMPNAGGLELLVLEGAFVESGEAFEPHSWLRLPPGQPLQAEAAASGCKLWLKSGHLARVQGVAVATA
jgi:hypothetical protein